MPSPRQLHEALAAKKVNKRAVELAVQIRTKLKALHITLDQLAAWEGVSRRKLNYWLAGEHLKDYHRQEQGQAAITRILRLLERMEGGVEKRPPLKFD